MRGHALCLEMSRKETYPYGAIFQLVDLGSNQNLHHHPNPFWPEPPSYLIIFPIYNCVTRENGKTTLKDWNFLIFQLVNLSYFSFASPSSSFLLLYVTRWPLYVRWTLWCGVTRKDVLPSLSLTSWPGKERGNPSLTFSEVHFTKLSVATLKRRMLPQYKFKY
jgi:hypothetical protein